MATHLQIPSIPIRRHKFKASSKAILLVLDLNGTLLDRRKNKSIIPRPGLDDFLSFIFENFAVMIWSSSREENVNKMVTKAFGPQKDNLIAIWDRRFCELLGNYHDNSKSKKNISSIWDINRIPKPKVKGSQIKSFPSSTYSKIVSSRKKWNLQNTILIDDSPFKASNNPGNFIPIKTFDKKIADTDSELSRLTIYLKKLLEYFSGSASEIGSISRPGLSLNTRPDVREYISKNAFLEI
ncbi:hypothetical protein BB560_000767 [Smittium megazygosporum]|uniref:Mitochondrial import inner membrane translocase subunit TIM50 n=1 Tax=Smittium megazygosporum TaxID=133381 RepID=A0A2T9ZJG3_9FUNG|nr:hypothetical protein BB560_000767 [Smittium megazygosporum]